MVAVALSILPLLLGGAIYTVGLAAGRPEASEISVAAGLHAALVAVAVTSALLAALKRRLGLRPSAWLALLASIVLFSAGELLELLMRSGDIWVEEILRVAAFLPLAAFAWQVASPLSIVYTSRRRAAAIVATAVAAFLVVATIELLPILAGASAPRKEIGGLGALTMVRPLLDVLLFLPLVASLAGVGLRRRGEPYLFIGLGMLAELGADILFHYDFLTGAAGLEATAFLFAAVSLAYFAIGSLWFTLRREEEPQEPAA